MKKIITKLKDYLNNNKDDNESIISTEFNRISITKSEYIKLSPNSIQYLAGFTNKLQTIFAMTNQWSELFGKHDFTYKGEYNCKNWTFIDNNDNYFFIISAPGRGTSIESSINIDDYLKTGKINNETKKSINNFIDFLFNNLITLDDENVNFWKNIKIK